VFSSGELVKELQQLKEDQKGGCVLFLNCGGQVDLTKTWLGDQEQVTALVLDSHRPVHHNNLGHHPQIKVCLDMDQERVDEMPSVQEIQFYNQNRHEIDLDRDEEDDLSDGEEDDEADEEEGDGEEESKGDARSNCDDEELLDGDDEDVMSKKRNRPEKSAGEKASKAERIFKRDKRSIGNKLRQYYEGAFNGISASMLTYYITKSLNRENKDLLWLSIIGLTD